MQRRFSRTATFAKLLPHGRRGAAQPKRYHYSAWSTPTAISGGLGRSTSRAAGDSFAAEGVGFSHHLRCPAWMGRGSNWIAGIGAQQGVLQSLAGVADIFFGLIDAHILPPQQGCTHNGRSRPIEWIDDDVARV